MSWEISCADMCRACMKVDGVLLPMYGDDDLISRKNLPRKLAELTSIQIDRHDGMPSMLCAKCAYRTDAFYEFKRQVRATEKKLRKMFEVEQIYCKEEKHEREENERDDWMQGEEISNSMEEEERIKEGGKKIPCNLHIEGETTNEEDAGILETSYALGAAINDGDSVVEKESNDFAEAQTEIEREDVELVESLDDIFVPEVQRDTAKEPYETSDILIRTEGPDEITRMLDLQPHDLDYTIMYIPENEMDSIVRTNGEHLFIANSEYRAPPEAEEEYRGEIFEIACEPLSVLPEAREDPNGLEEALSGSSSDPGRSEAENESFSAKFIAGGEASGEDSENETEVSRGKAKETVDTEDEDSDYFVDSKDNVLGSLNDAITRIKEIRVGEENVQYQCTLCMQNYEQLTGILIHTVDYHVPSGGPFFCVVCEKDCESRRQLRVHVKTHKGALPYTCFICGKAYSLKRYLKRHMICHTDFPRHRCPKCGTRFQTKTELETHIATHIRGAPYACSQCPRLFNHKGNYKRHLISHLDPQGLHLPKYPCSVCDKRFLNNRTLETHMRVHTGEKPFKCEICGKYFSQQGNLLNHMRIHSNPRSYTCEVCGKSFNQRATLRDHSLLHTGEKPYICNVCGVAFTFSAALRRHMWTHAGGKPFGCEICDARFVGKYDLKRHMSIHSDRPRTKRKRNGGAKRGETDSEEAKERTDSATQESGNVETILIEQVLLNQDATEVIAQEESEKENVDALLNLIQYG